MSLKDWKSQLTRRQRENVALTLSAIIIIVALIILTISFCTLGFWLTVGICCMLFIGFIALILLVFLIYSFADWILRVFLSD